MPEQFMKKRSIGEPLRDETKYNTGPNPYSHRRYRKFRERIKKKQRIVDEKKVHKIYEEDTSIPFERYNAFLKSNNPLCVECLEGGEINTGRVLDHIKPIEKGGAKYEDDNLQWLCDRHHNIKRSTTDKA